ncbi:MAG: dehydrogenase [Candidatus Hydrogenedentota bacterium]
MSKYISRRTFIYMGAATLAAGCATKGGKKTAGPRKVSPNDKLNIAAIGSGGKGGSDIAGCSKENVVALCDVDWANAAETFAKFPDAKQYKDFREMLDKESIDAVTISTPDHFHAIAAMAAMERGIHVYVQKPLTHTVWEARLLTEAARKYKVKTQMGNQGRSGEGVRQLTEMIWGGAIGQVREVHCWTNRPIWPQGLDRPDKTDAIPDTLDWDLWLGPAPERPYVDKHPVTNEKCYCPFVWRGWWDFGCGALGDMACHIMDPAFYSLQLGYPTSFELVTQEGRSSEMAPNKSIVKFDFPERVAPDGKKMDPVAVYWYDGGLMPPMPEGLPADTKLGEGNNGSLFIGDKGMATTGTYGDGSRLLPDAVNEAYQRPEPFLPRVKGSHYTDWISAIKGEQEQAGSYFDYAGPFSETVLLGNLAVRCGEAGQKFEWDAKAMKITNVPEANQFVSKEYRKGWEISL